MSKPKQAAFSKPIRNIETPAALIVSKAKITPIAANNTVTSCTSNERKKTITTTKGIDQQASTSNIKVTSKVVLNMIKKTSITAPVAYTPTPCKTDANDLLDKMILCRLEAATINWEHPSIPPHHRFLHNFRLIWLDSNDFRSHPNYARSTLNFRPLIDAIEIFTSAEKCVEFLRTEINDTFFMIASNELAQSIMSYIHNMPHIHSIFIFCENLPEDEQWIKSWIKIKGFFTNIDPICNILWREIPQYRRDSTTIGVSNRDLTRMDPWFMCTQLLKQVLLEMKFDDREKKRFIQFYRQKHYVDNSVLDEFEHTYHLHTSIWWYTRDSFLFDMVNRAFQLQDINVIIKMGFFIRDLHHQIEKICQPISEQLTLYKGQTLSYVHFKQLQTMHGGLFSFNSFLSASIDEKVAMSCADSFRHDPDLIGIVFQINVQPAAFASSQFVSLDNESYFTDSKGEFLFTMHTVFRIGEIKKIEDHLWQVELLLVNDNEKDLKQLTKYIEEATQESTGWDQLAKLLLKMKHFNKAEEVLDLLIENSVKDDVQGLGYRYHLMGLVKTSKGEYKKAILYFHKALTSYLTSTDSNDLNIATIYNDLGSLYRQIEEYDKALYFFQMAIDIQKESSPLNYLNLVITYDNMAELNKDIKKYSIALHCYQHILEIHKQSIPFNFSKLASSCRNLAEMYYSMEDYSKALKLFQTELSIQQDYYSQNFIDMATIENNISKTCERMGDHATSVEHYQNALKYCQMALENLNGYSIHYVSDLANIYNSMAEIHMTMKEYVKVLEFYKKTIRILNKYPHVKKPDLATIYDNLGQVYGNMRLDKEAFLSYRKAIDITRQSSIPNPSKLRLYQTHYHAVPKENYPHKNIC